MLPYCEQPLGIELLVFHGLRVFMLTDAKGRFWIVAGSGTDKQINQCPNLCLILASIARCLSQYAHQFQQNRLIFSSSVGDQVRITWNWLPRLGQADRQISATAHQSVLIKRPARLLALGQERKGSADCSGQGQPRRHIFSA